MNFISLELLPAHKDFQQTVDFLQKEGFTIYVFDPSLNKVLNYDVDEKIIPLPTEHARVEAVVNGKSFSTELIVYIKEHHMFNDGPIVRYTIKE